MAQGLNEKSGKKCILLRSMDAYVSVVDDCVEVNFKQIYHNSSEDPVEAVYSLILPRDNAVSGFVVTTEGKKIKAVVKDLEEAKDEYDDAISSGNSAYLVEPSERVDVNEFKINVANLPPNKTAQVDITFLTTLRTESSGKQLYRLPAELLPKQGEFSFTCELLLSSGIKRVESTNGATISGDFRKIEWKGDAKNISTDFAVTIFPEALNSYAIIESDHENPKLQAAMITLFPKHDNSTTIYEPKNEFVFVVDRSGSMSGSSIQFTRKALNILLHAIPPESKFNIIGFGTSTQYLFPSSVEYTATNLETAKNHCEKMNADLGGTDLLKPLRGIFSTKMDPDYPRIIFVLTDGEVDDRNGTIAEVKRSIENGRLFALGIGSGVDKNLVTGMASAGRGNSIFVQRSDGIEEAVMGLFQEATVPQFKKIEVLWPDNTLQTPYVIPTTEINQRVVIYGLIDNNPIDEVIQVQAQGPDGPIKWNIHAVYRKGNTIQRYVAFSLIRDLQEGKSILHANNTPSEKIKEAITKLGIKYQLATKYTSFIAVEELDVAATGSLKTVEVETATPQIEKGINMSQVLQQLKESEQKKKAEEEAKQARELHRRKEEEERYRRKEEQELHHRRREDERYRRKEKKVHQYEEEQELHHRRQETRKRVVKQAETKEVQKLEDILAPVIQQPIVSAVSKSKDKKSLNLFSKKSKATAGKAKNIDSNMRLKKDIAYGEVDRERDRNRDRDEPKTTHSLARGAPAPAPAPVSFQPSQSSGFAAPAPGSIQSPQSSSFAAPAPVSFQSQQQQLSSFTFDPSPAPLILENSISRSISAVSESLCSEDMEEEDVCEIDNSYLERSYEISQPSKEKLNVNMSGKGYDQLVGKQSFTGNWDISSIAQFIGISAEEILKHKPENISDDIWATAFAIAILEIKFSSSKNIWGMVAKKARVFITKELAKQGITSTEATTKVEEMIEKAQELM